MPLLSKPLADGSGDRTPFFFPLNDPEWLASSLRGWRNAVVRAGQIRLPYIYHAAIFALLYADLSKPGALSKLKYAMKAAFYHGRNLGLFVFIYKTLCTVLRNVGVTGGAESWIAGFVGGAVGFGERGGVCGAVNNQVALYLTVRGLEAMALKGAAEGYLPRALFDFRSQPAFALFSGFALAIILYCTEYQRPYLKQSFWSTMDYIYYDSERVRSPLLPATRWRPMVLLVALSYLGYLPIDGARMLAMDSLMNTLIGQ